jgi:hypothetical protein
MLRWVSVRVGFGRRGVLVLFCNGSYVLGGGCLDVMKYMVLW